MYPAAALHYPRGKRTLLYNFREKTVVRQEERSVDFSYYILCLGGGQSPWWKENS